MPLTVAHRGANRRAPQNTIPAFQAAIERGADGVEFDVQMTKDRQLVICHNFMVDETSDGFGLISNKTFDELRALDFGSWFSPAFAGTKIPTLKEVLDVVKDMKVLDIEIKRPYPWLRDEIVKKTVDQVRDMGLAEKVIISSFDFATIDAVKAYDASIKCGLLYDPKKDGCEDRALLHGGFIQVARKHQADALHPFFLLTHYPRFFTDMCHRNGLMVNVWGISPEYSTYLPEYEQSGVDMIITDLV